MHSQIEEKLQSRPEKLKIWWFYMNNSTNKQPTQISEYIFVIYNQNDIVYYIQILAQVQNLSQTCIIPSHPSSRTRGNKETSGMSALVVPEVTW